MAHGRRGDGQLGALPLPELLLLAPGASAPTQVAASSRCLSAIVRSIIVYLLAAVAGLERVSLSARNDRACSRRAPSIEQGHGLVGEVAVELLDGLS